MRDKPAERDGGALGRCGSKRARQFDEQREGGEKPLRPAALEGKFARHLLPAAAERTKNGILRQEHVGEHDLIEMMFATEIEDRTNFQPGVDVFEVDEKLRQSGMALFAFLAGAAKQDHVMRAVRIRGPHFGAVDQEAALHRARTRAHGREIGAGIRLAHANAKIAFAGGDARQDIVFLLVGADAQQQRSALPVRDPMATNGRTGGKHFFQHNIAFERGALMAAIPLRPGHADPALRAHLAAELRIEAAPGAAALLRRAICILLAEKGAHFAAQRFGLRRMRRRSETQCVHGSAFVCFGGFRSRTMRASATVSPCPSGCTMTGFSSISSTSRRPSAISEMRAIKAASADTSAAGEPRNPMQQRRGLQLIEHGSGVGCTDRGGAIHDVIEQLRDDAAEPDHHHRSENIVANRADDDLDPGLCHRAYQHALDDGTGAHGFYLRKHLPISRVRACGISNPELHAADLALMRHIRGLNF